MMPLTIRAATSSDLPEILRIQAACPDSARWTAADWERLLESPGTERAWVATDQQAQLAGFLLCRVIDAAEAEVLDLAVDPPQRRRGVARALLDAFFAGHAGETFLEVRASNQPAIALYRQAGFLATGSRRAYYHSPVENAVVMRRSVKTAKMEPKRD